MISLSMTEYNVTGNVIFQESGKSNLQDKVARVHRVATLDGGSVISHYGYSDSDRTLLIKAFVSRSQAEILQRFFEDTTHIWVALADGLFLGSISKYKDNKGVLQMTILIEKREI